MEVYNISRGGSRTAATSKMELFVIVVNGLQLLTVITKYSISDVVCSSPRSAFGSSILNISMFEMIVEVYG